MYPSLRSQRRQHEVVCSTHAPGGKNTASPVAVCQVTIDREGYYLKIPVTNLRLCKIFSPPNFDHLSFSDHAELIEKKSLKSIITGKQKINFGFLSQIFEKVNATDGFLFCF